MANLTETDNAPVAERRSFLGVLSGLIMAGITAVMGVTIGRFAIAPAFFTAGKEMWADVGPLADIPEGQPVRKNVTVIQEAGWQRINQQKAVWVIKKGEQLTVYTAVCPHLGCTVNLGANNFICACHNSSWDAAGKMLAGPSPRGLDTLEHRVEGDMLKVRYQNFKQGVSTKEVMS